MTELWTVTDNNQTVTLARSATLTRNLLTTWQNAAGRLWKEDVGTDTLRPLTEDEYAHADARLHGIN
jgi:hypothetical protein